MAGEGARVEMDDPDGARRAAAGSHSTSSIATRLRPGCAERATIGQQQPWPARDRYEAAFVAAQADLEEIATHTGGVFRHTPQDLYRGLKQAISLEGGSYTVGYYVTEYLSPKRLRKVKVNATRRGVQVVHRRGYYSQATYSESFNGTIRLGKPLRLEADGRPGQFQPFSIEVESEGRSATRTSARRPWRTSLCIFASRPSKAVRWSIPITS